MVQKTSSIILSYSPVPNVTRDEERALRELRSDESIVILKADKGNAAVILNKDDYNQKVKKN